MSAEVKCKCQFCNQHTAFPAEMAGQMFACPHCGLETKLFIPQTSTTPKPGAPTNPPVPQPTIEKPDEPASLLGVMPDLPTTPLPATRLRRSVGSASPGIAPGRTPAARMKSSLAQNNGLFERIIANFPIKPQFLEMPFGISSNILISSICCAYRRVTSLYDMTFGHFRV